MTQCVYCEATPDRIVTETRPSTGAAVNACHAILDCMANMITRAKENSDA